MKKNKIWQKNSVPLKEVERFTVGNDPDFDLLLAPYDVMGSLGHAFMLKEIHLISQEEYDQLKSGLIQIYDEIAAGKFEIAEGVEDVHSQVEILLTERLGDVGKKLHSGRSRNDQVLLDLKLYYRARIEGLLGKVEGLIDLFLDRAEELKSDLMPGYTHSQLAMPSSFGLWLSSFAEGLVEDLDLLFAAFELVNKNPLGSAAGYGSSFPLDRGLTTHVLGFEKAHINAINAQNSRGKTERNLAFALSGFAATLNRFAADSILFMNQHYGFISFPDELTTGSSIMPHKKNPDVFEIIRAQTTSMMVKPQELNAFIANYTTGYHRDLQLTKSILIPLFDQLEDCIQMTQLMLENMQVKKDILKDDKYRYLFTVEAVNERVLAGVPFREAYVQVGEEVEAGAFQYELKALNHTHVGSIGNLSLDLIKKEKEEKLEKFPYWIINEILGDLFTR
ncbi:MAG: argininosuccinate lyase [Cyclobacteriaceae bacterium]|nr:argininosuccinate lyase [Cyclobacteriaceae bacterium]MCH8515730.1 argininosuccinate lyase [Cyclobacteriaceae bacterium]